MRAYPGAENRLDEISGYKEDLYGERVYWKFPLAIHTISASVSSITRKKKTTTVVHLKDKETRDNSSGFLVELTYK